MKISELFATILERRYYQLEFYREVSPEIWTSAYAENTWSAEMIFRHFLMSTAIMRKMITGEDKERHPLAIMGGPQAEIEPKKSYGIDEVENALRETADELMKIIREIPDEKFKEKRKNFYGKEVTIEQQLVSLLLHDSEHLGELKFTFKRLANYDDNAMYRMKK